MYCPMCGKANDDRAKFCQECGYKLADISSKLKAQPAEVKPHAEETDLKTFQQEKKIKKLSKPFFLGSIAAGLGIGYLLSIMGLVAQFGGEEDVALGFSLLSLMPLLFGGVIWLVLIYRMWASIPDDFARTSPGKAVGLLFVPFFNFYWQFQATWGFSKDYNRFVSKLRPDAPRLPEGLFLAYPIITLTSILTAWLGIGLLLSIANVVILLLLVSRVCDAVNSLAPAEDEGVEHPARSVKSVTRTMQRKPVKSWIAVAASVFALLVFLIIFLIIFFRPALEVSSLRVEPKEAVPGEDVVVYVEVENTGRARGTYRGVLMVNGQEITIPEKEVAARTKETLAIELPAESPGVYYISLEDLSETFRVLIPAEFTVDGIIITPNPVNRGEEATVTVSVSNIGEAEGTHSVSLIVDGKVEDSREVVIGGGSTEEVSFSISKVDPGSYTIEVAGLMETLQVVQIERPDNGTLLVNQLGGGYGQLRIKNNINQDAVVVLSSPENPKTPLLAVYVRAESSYTVRRIKDGTYITYVSHGEDWDSYSKRFTRNVSYDRFVDENRFKTTHTSTGYTYTVVTIELGVITDEPVPTESVDPDEFPVLP